MKQKILYLCQLILMIKTETISQFKKILMIINHPQFGYIIDFQAVQILSNGNLGIKSESIHLTNIKHFDLNENEIKFLKWIEEYDVENLFKRFVKTNKKIRPNDYFSKNYTPELHKKIREFIDKRIVKIISFAGDFADFYLWNNNKVAPVKVYFSNFKAQILFHLRRNKEGTKYFATIKLGEKKLELNPENSIILIEEPAWLVVNNHLFCFEKETDGKKIKPFINKHFIKIEPRSENEWYNKFGIGLVEDYDVYAKGVEIIKHQFEAVPVLKLNMFGDQLACSLYFNYGNHQFVYHSQKFVSVWLDNKDNNFTFNRIKRSRNWEDNIKIYLEEIGLKLKEGSLFFSKNSEPLGVVDVINQNYDKLISKHFILDQSMLKYPFVLGEWKMFQNLTQHNDWFDLNITVNLNEFKIPFVKLKKHIQNGIREYILPDNSIAIIPNEWMTKYSPLFDFSNKSEDSLKVHKQHLPLVKGIFKTLKNETDSVETKSEFLIPKSFKTTLRNYQKEGFDWLLNLHQQKLGACLADDMGLGKTVQILAYWVYVQENEKLINENETKQFDLFSNLNNIQNTHLLIVPNSLIYNWVNEIKKFTSLSYFVHKGMKRMKSLNSIFGKYDIIITTYGTMRNDIEHLCKLQFASIVLDESQAIKRSQSITASHLNKLNGDHKIALTGTPIENSITDLWSQLNFINPGLLGNFNLFQKKYVNAIETLKDEKAINTLKSIVKPYILRRTKEMVAPELPLKSEEVKWCEMTTEQEKVYTETKSYLRNELISQVGNISKTKFVALQGLTKLRQIANHPQLIEEFKLINSGKFEMVSETLLKIVELKHKVLIFSPFVKHLEIYAQFLSKNNIHFEEIYGSTESKERIKKVENFQKNEDIKVFLISLKAGGFGLNLTAADYVFLLDPWWNPAAERQAMDRTHRIGQKKPVIVYKFITKDSIEEKILKLQNKKLTLSENILDFNDENIFKKLNKEDIVDLFG